MANFTTDKRARLYPARRARETVLGPDDCNNILEPLWRTNGLVWPYTPDVMFGAVAAYGEYHFTHSNYKHYNYQNSAPEPITITSTFTAQTNDEARYLIAALRFLRSAQMMEFGIRAARRDAAGTPPPVLRFNYLGAHMFNHVPVVVSTFNYQLERDVDYVEVQFPGDGRFRPTGEIGDSVFGDVVLTEDQRTYVPTRIVLTTVLQIQQNVKTVREDFDLESFKRGDLINKGFI